MRSEHEGDAAADNDARGAVRKPKSCEPGAGDQRADKGEFHSGDGPRVPGVEEHGARGIDRLQ